jgi:hypothetical protein
MRAALLNKNYDKPTSTDLKLLIFSEKCISCIAPLETYTRTRQFHPKKLKVIFCLTLEFYSPTPHPDH